MTGAEGGSGAGGCGGARLPGTATGFARALKGLIPHVSLWFLLLLSEVSSQFSTGDTYWDGCFPSYQNMDNDTRINYCYKITSRLPANDAWNFCTALSLPVFNTTAESDITVDDYGSVAGDAEEEDTDAKVKNALRKEMLFRYGVTSLWMGGRQMYSGATTYVAVDGSTVTPSELVATPDDGEEHCLAITAPWSATEKDTKLQSHECDASLELNALCAHRKYEGVMHNASEACRDFTAVAIPPLRGCYVSVAAGIDTHCGKGDTTLVVVLPKTPQNMSAIARSRAVEVEILEMTTRGKLLRNAGGLETMENATTYSYCSREWSERDTFTMQLRYNKTADGLTLWVGSPGLAVWPPLCVGGRVADPDADPRALAVTATGGDKPRAIWCYAQHILNGTGVSSNRVLRPGLKPSTCPDAKGSEGPPPGTKVNTEASCLQCLHDLLEGCLVRFYCMEACPHGNCSNISNSFRIVEKQLNRESRGKYSSCYDDNECRSKAIWRMTEGDDDCNGDGVVDCEDRLVRFFDPSCRDGVLSDPTEDLRMLPMYERFWNCRHDRRADFVDLKHENGTARYFCLSEVYGKRRWDGPIFVDSTLYTSSSIFERVSEEMSEEAGVEAFRELRWLAERGETLTEEELENSLIHVRNLLELKETELRKYQKKAATSSVLSLLRDIMVLALPEANITEDNVAVSKTTSIGVKLLSDDPIGRPRNKFGPSPRQTPIASAKEINEHRNEIETAVVLSNLPENVTLVVTTFADGADFISCGEWKDSKVNATNEEASRARQYGCLNSHVVGVGLLKNSTYIPLPLGSTVNITFRSKIALLPGQKKICVYRNPEDDIWATDGCRLLVDGMGSGELDTCECDHLTHFAELVTDGALITGAHADVLHVLTISACAISLLGLTGIVVAGILGQKWRKKPENKVLVNLALAVAASMAVFLWSSVGLRPSGTDWCQSPDAVCRLRGAFLHFFVLAGFCWMLVAASTHYVRLTRLTGVAGYSHFALKAALVGWGAPLLPVAALAAVDADAYAGANRDFCYPSGAAFYAAVLGPISLVLLVNLLTFFLILRRLFPKFCAGTKSEPALRRWGVDERRVKIRTLIICTAFTFLFGLTWYLGLLSYSVVPAYVFCVAVALQGPALFLFFVLGEESVRNKLKSIRKRMASPKEGTPSASHMSTSNSVAAYPKASDPDAEDTIDFLPKGTATARANQGEKLRKGGFMETPM